MVNLRNGCAVTVLTWPRENVVPSLPARWCPSLTARWGCLWLRYRSGGHLNLAWLPTTLVAPSPLILGCVVGKIKMGNIVITRGTESTSLPFRACVLTIPSWRLPWCHHYTHTYLSIHLLAWEVSAAYYRCIISLVGWFLEFLTKVITGWIPFCNRVHSWWLHSVAPLGDLATRTITWYPFQLHFSWHKATPVLALSQ